jgi:hypothetical protein
MWQVREEVFRLAMLLEDIYTMHGLGALSTAHTEEDLSHLYGACERTAQLLKGPLTALY